MSKFTLTKKRVLISVVVICILVISGLTLWLNTGHVAEAALLNPHPGLVGWWRFDEGTGTVAGDSSGNGNNGTIYGATWVTGKYGNALSFNGVSNYVEVPNSNSLNPTSALTIMMWVKPSVNIQSGNWYPFTDKRDGGVAWGLYYNTAGYLYLYINSGQVVRSSTRTFYANSWYYIAVTAKNGSSDNHLYINGVEDTYSSSAQTFITNTAPVKIATDYAKSIWFNGTIDEVRIYNRALSAAEIQADFQEGPDFSVNLLAKVPKGTTQVITTLSWQGTGSINVTIVSPSQNYTESMLPEYQKTVYSTSSGTTSMLNIKRLSVSVSALSSDQNWYIVLTFDNVSAYQITVEVQK